MRFLFGYFLISIISYQAICQKEMAVTIDDFPIVSMDNSDSNQVYVMSQLITNLKQNKAPALGLVNEGKLYEKGIINDVRLQALESWLSAGYELGNHSYSHMNFDRNDTTSYFEDIKKGEEISKSLSEKYSSPYRYFRHPYLHAGNTLEKEIALESFLAREGYLEAPVTIDNSEWIFARAYDKARKEKDEQMLAKIGTAYVNYMLDKTHFFEGNAQSLFDRPIKHVLLLHANNLNADYLDDLLKALADDGYEFVSLEKALEDPAYQTNDHIAKPWGISWLHRWSRHLDTPDGFYKGEPACPQFIQTYAGITE